MLGREPLLDRPVAQQAGDLPPNLPPRSELGRPDLVAREIPFMQAEKLALRCFAKAFALRRIDVLAGPRGDVLCGLLLVHPPANDRADHFAQRRPVPQPERIGFAERLPDGGITRGGTLIGPDKYVAQQLGLVEFIDPEHRVGIGAARHALEGERRDTRLLTSSNGCKYGSCTMTKNACSNGSVMAAAVARIWSKHSSMSCGTSSGWKEDRSMATLMRRSLPAASGSASRLFASSAWRLRMV